MCPCDCVSVSEMKVFGSCGSPYFVGRLDGGGREGGREGEGEEGREKERKGGREKGGKIFCGAV